MSAGTEWIDLYHPEQQAWHRVPDNEAVVRYFRDLGWDTPEDSAARAEEEAGQLRGRELDDALEAEGLSKGGTVKEKQARLAAAKKAEAAQSAEDATVEGTTKEEGSE